MKRVLIILTVITLAFSLVGCSASSTDTAEREKVYRELLESIIEKGSAITDINNHVEHYRYVVEENDDSGNIIEKYIGFEPDNKEGNISESTDLSFSWVGRYEEYTGRVQFVINGCDDTFYCSWEYSMRLTNSTRTSFERAFSGRMEGIEYSTYSIESELPDIIDTEGRDYKWAEITGETDMRSGMIDMLYVAITDFSNIIETEFNVEICDLGFSNLESN